jgi:hypothetical protein
MKLVWVFLILFVASISSYGAQVELLVNPGFEDGVLDPWTTNGWMLDSTDPHSGFYYTYSDKVGACYIEQAFEPTDVDDIISFTFWQKYGGTSFSYIRLYYGDTDYDLVTYFISEEYWVQFDLTSELRSSGNLEAVRVYDQTSVPPANAYLDDASIIYEDYVGIKSSSLGNIKATFK